MLLKNNKGQIGIYVVIALIIVIAIILYFVFKESNGFENVPVELAGVYEHYIGCINDEVKATADLAGSQGGNLDSKEYLSGSDYSPFSSHLNFLGFAVPYWYYLSGNGILNENVPKKSEIEEQMGNFVETRLKECDFEEFAQRGIIVENGEPEVSISIENNKIIAKVRSEINAKKEESSARKVNYQVEVESDFGAMYKNALSIYENEKKNSFLENYAEDVLRLNAPVDGLEISCSPAVWKTREIAQEVKNALESNIQSIKLKGSYYTPNENNKYFVLEQESTTPVRFLYDKNWPSKFEVSESNGEILLAEPIGNQAGLGAIGFCYIPYHFVYDLSFPVMVQIYNEKGEVFQFPIVVIIDKNMPRKAEFGETLEEDEDSDVCAFKTQEIEVRVFDSKLNKINSSISYQCFEQKCKLGEAEEGVFIGKSQSCLNGQLIVESVGYSMKEILFSSNEEKLAEIILDKEYDLELEIELDGKSLKENAVVSFVGEKTISYYYPENKRVKLSEGSYNISVQVYGNSSIVIPASTKRECIEVSKGGVSGIFGVTQEKCFDINVGENKIEHALIGGGNAESYILSEQLEKGKLKIKTKAFPKPDSLERLQYNYELLEQSKLEVGE